MTELEATNALYQLWDAGWEAKHPGSRAPADTAQALCVPWTAENEAFSPGNLGPLGCWVSVVFRPATDQQLTQGPVAFNEATGLFIIRIFGPLNEGTAKLVGLADEARAVMKRKRSGELRTLDAPSSASGFDREGIYAMRVVTVEVRYTYTQ